MRSKTLLFAVISALFLTAVSAPTWAQDAATADLDAIKTYLLDKAAALKTSTETLHTAAQGYYDLAKTADFAYETLAGDAEAQAFVLDAQSAWMTASPLYEQIEGIVAGVPSLSEFDVILDAGASGADDPEGGVPFDLTLADGRVLERPGNLFGLLESTLWGTRAEFSSGVAADLNANDAADFGELLPEANMLLASAEALDSYSADMLAAAEAWQPNETDAFTALVVMVPTMSEYFASWKESRFIAAEAEASAEFAVISRLSDIQDILSSLQVVYDGVQPLADLVSAEQSTQIEQDLADLKAYVGDLYAEEQDGRAFTPEEADFFGSEAQDRAMAITGQIAQVAALLDITLPE